MATIIRMPSVLAGANEAAIAKWLVKPGDSISEGSPFAELETEKAVVEYNAEVSGTIGRLVIPEGGSGEIGAPIAVLIEAGETDADIDAALGDEGGAAAEVPVVEAVAVAVEVPSATPAVFAVAAAPTAVVSTGGRSFASPIARKIARERGLDLSAVQGTGPGGRIVRRDLDSAPTLATPVAAAVAEPVSEETIEMPHTGMRKAIARRLTESKSTVPHFYLTTECKVDALLALREQINAYSPVRVSVNDLVVKAAAMAFVDVPDANVTWTDTALIKHGTVDISVAVSTEGGLVTPVVRNITSKSVSSVSAEIKDLVGRAQDKRLKQDELEGGSFSISNLGMYGTLEFAAILNPPQSGILAVGAAKEQPVVMDGQLTVAKVMRCTLSADHRAIDGALAAQWLAAFTDRIENPVSLLI
ncbi:pyruvate dehydrogenase E2 component (dihydrolipoamide acetyltransferase) [Aurantimicrobium minutum]|uniref:dihydrolipoamide acetyltransferase family protein n=1 Tax=Aurantimicrobium minutum TaxID=708131 RepID=UPI0024754581|nr:dihydrolipoamide acetyltransferase family protein [Aurantimicrobium minutum]MDH6207098.1 pyruvate dehydrogenase E2 component (dihydrolipoamide acetyltransferase) [Aurantimicrobium minutum]MDH6424290.1 pyruvate dehydrogenase E2 component (dihydrolipoamide acetyltransferase) [Aurantimicrobium minutum]